MKRILTKRNPTEAFRAMTNGRSVPRGARRLNRSLSIYRQIEAILREQIVSGEFASGDRLPTEAELSELYSVSRPTVRLALEGLEQEKLVRREQGRGSFVRKRAYTPTTKRHEISLEASIEPAAPVTIALQRSGTIRGYGIVHEMMKLPEGTEILYFVRIYSLGSQPIGGAKVHVPMELGNKLREKDYVARDVIQTLSMRCGIRSAVWTLSIDSALAEPRFAEMLRAATGTPLISMRRTTHDEAGAAIEHSQMLFRPDLCQISAKRAFRAG